MAQRIHTVVVGAGHSGLALSRELSLRGVEHVVVDRVDQLAHPWRTARWDSFTMNTPNWFTALPGMPYEGDEPDGFSDLAYFISYLETYAAAFEPPLRWGVEVTGIHRTEGTGRFSVETSGKGGYDADNVVVAAGVNQAPSVPTMSHGLPARIVQMHSGAYRNPSALPGGAVLVVGSGDSGCQVAEELHDAGREVYLSVSSAGRRPRRYRGRDSNYWSATAGLANTDFTGEPSFAENAQNSGAKGGHTINLHQFANDGVTLVGHLLRVEGERLTLALDVADNLARADANCGIWKRRVDEYIEREGIDAPPAQRDPLDEARSDAGATAPATINLSASGITTVIWATGYRYDFSWIPAPVLNPWGFPVQRGGATGLPGLFFIGVQGALPGNLRSVSRYAPVIADAIVGGKG